MYIIFLNSIKGKKKKDHTDHSYHFLPTLKLLNHTIETY